MSSPVRRVPSAVTNLFDSRKAPPVAGGNEPPHDGGMETRVANLEKTMGDVRERLASVEAKVDSIDKHGAKSADIAALRGELGTGLAGLRADGSTMESRLIRWFILTALGIGGIAFAIARFMK